MVAFFFFVMLSARLLTIITILNCFIVPVIVFNVLVLKVPALNDIQPFVIISGSMEPVIPTGSLIYTLRQPEYSKGDIVTFSTAGEYIAHRVVNKLTISGETYFATKGDANVLEDFDLVHQSAVQGKIITAVPYVGNGILFYRTQAGMMLGIGIPICLYLILGQKRLRKAYELN